MPQQSGESDSNNDSANLAGDHRLKELAQSLAEPVMALSADDRRYLLEQLGNTDADPSTTDPPPPRLQRLISALRESVEDKIPPETGTPASDS